MISLDEAKSVLSPYESDFSWCVTQAWQRWQTEHAPRVPLAFPRGRANMMYELMIDEARKRFEGAKGLVFFEQYGRLLLNVRDRVLIRFKKLDDTLRTHNYPTLFSLQFDAQADLPGMVSKLPRITVGYRLNYLQTDIENPLVVFSVGKRTKWFYELEKPAAVDVILLPTPIVSPAKQEPAVTLKKDRDEGQKKKQAAQVIKFPSPK